MSAVDDHLEEDSMNPFGDDDTLVGMRYPSPIQWPAPICWIAKQASWQHWLALFASILLYAMWR